MLLGRILSAKNGDFVITQLYSSMLMLSIAKNLSINLMPRFDKPVLSVTEGLTMSGKIRSSLRRAQHRL